MSGIGCHNRQHPQRRERIDDQQHTRVGDRRGPVWILATPPGKSDFEAWREPDAEPPALVVQVGTTQLRYHLR